MSGAVDTLVSPEIGAHAVAVVREAVSNVVRHDGVGIDPEAARSGLHNLADRAQECGGELTVRREPGGGTRLSWCVPLS